MHYPIRSNGKPPNFTHTIGRIAFCQRHWVALVESGGIPTGWQPYEPGKTEQWILRVEDGVANWTRTATTDFCGVKNCTNNCQWIEKPHSVPWTNGIEKSHGTPWASKTKNSKEQDDARLDD